MLVNYYRCIKNAGFIAVFFYIITCTACTSKKGCTDPAALNFTVGAKIDNGSCQYPEKHLDVIKLTKLDDLFKENSGLEYVNGQLWTVMDGGAESKIYSLNFSNGDRLEEIELKGVLNIDFEALAASSSHYYVADIGNNDGDRTDLGIYKFPIPSTTTQSTEVLPERIQFHYPEQQDFNENPETTNFDAEAALYHQNKIYVFTKNHGDRHTVLYEVPEEAGEHAAVAKGRLNVQMLVTDADINDLGDKVVLIGHDYQQVYLWLFQDFEGSKFFTGKKTRINLGHIDLLGQIEGVAFFDDKSVFISNEQRSGVNPKVYYLDLSGIE